MLNKECTSSEIGADLLRKLIEDRSGIVVPKDKTYLLTNRLYKLMEQHNTPTMNDLYRLALENRNVLTAIIDLMSTNETMWFRDEQIWSFISDTLIKSYFEKLKQNSAETIRIWCAACSTGQEPYSIAMQIDRMSLRYQGIQLSKFEILGTDISETTIKIAKTGIFNKVEMSRGLPEDFKDKYFKQVDNGWTLANSILNMVNFRKFNLQDQFYSLGTFDLILCRNVAIYFSEKLKREVFQKCAASLKQDGTFFVGASESLHGYYDIFKKHQQGKVIYYTKSG